MRYAFILIPALLMGCADNPGYTPQPSGKSMSDVFSELQRKNEERARIGVSGRRGQHCTSEWVGSVLETHCY